LKIRAGENADGRVLWMIQREGASKSKRQGTCGLSSQREEREHEFPAKRTGLRERRSALLLKGVDGRLPQSFNKWR